MLKVYICPICHSVRFVSKENKKCHKCNCDMILSRTAYVDFINFSADQRINCITRTLQKTKTSSNI